MGLAVIARAYRRDRRAAGHPAANVGSQKRQSLGVVRQDQQRGRRVAGASRWIGLQRVAVAHQQCDPGVVAERQVAERDAVGVASAARRGTRARPVGSLPTRTDSCHGRSAWSVMGSRAGGRPMGPACPAPARRTGRRRRPARRRYGRPSTPPRIASAARRMGTAPFRPLQCDERACRGARMSDEPVSVSATVSGRGRRRRARASARRRAATSQRGGG